MAPMGPPQMHLRTFIILTYFTVQIPTHTCAVGTFVLEFRQIQNDYILIIVETYPGIAEGLPEFRRIADNASQRCAARYIHVHAQAKD